MKTFFLITSLYFLSLCGWSQTFEVPKNYNLSTAEDFRSYNDDIIQCAFWLYDKPYDAKREKHREAQEFFFSWLVGTPDVKIEVTGKVAKLTKSNPDLLLIYMISFAKTVLEEPSTLSEDANAKAVYELVQYYVSNLDNGLKKEESMTPLIDMTQLEISDWLKK